MRPSTAFRFKPGDLQKWRNLDDACVVVYHSWETSLHRIASFATVWHGCDEFGGVGNVIDGDAADDGCHPWVRSISLVMFDGPALRSGSIPARP